MKNMNTRETIRCTVIGLILSLFAGVLFLTPIRVHAGQYDADPSSLDGTNWMKGIDGSRLLSEINIPGTHDSCTANAISDDKVATSSGSTQFARA